MENDPYILIARKLIEPVAEGFVDSIRLAWRLAKAPFVIVYNFIKGGR